MSEALVSTAAQAVSPVLEKIKPECVRVQHDGMVYRDVVVYVPASVTPTALNEHPDLWSVVQQNQMHALRPLDRLVIIAADQSWLLECWVAGADDKSVSLSPGRIVKMEQRSSALFADGKYAVVFMDGSYGVRRLADGLMVESGFATAAIAERALIARYPKRA